MPETLVILNVDDNEAPRYTKTRQLRQAGFQVAEAMTGLDALRQVATLLPAVVVLDVQLPDISGIDVCRQIKLEWPRTMVLQTSATYTTGADRTRGLESGADGYLTQPIEPGELAAAVRALLRIRKAEDDLRTLNATLEERVLERTRELATANERLKNEIEQRMNAEAALVQSQKMEAIGHLTGGIAHDFNNLLTAVVGNIDLIKKRANDPGLLRLAENAHRAAQRGSKLTSQLLAFSRTQQLTLAPVDVNAVIGGMSDLLRQSLGPSISIIQHLPSIPAIAVADENQLELAILNLAINSRDAMPDGGTLTISVTKASESSASDADGDTSVRISIRDTGAGMTPQVAARAFDPFFTTKPPGKGTGLGLSQVYGIIRQTGGDVILESEIGRGTAIELRLPGFSGHHVSKLSPKAPRAAQRQTGTILVVDDDADVRNYLTDLLEGCGYTVLAYGSPFDGLDAVSAQRPDLVLVDYAMPGATGAGFIESLKRIDSAIKIVLVSGYSDVSAVAAVADDVTVVRKPFDPDHLLMVIQDRMRN